jgi:nuclear transport factor 2 (NTF2) superfamily protein
MYRTHPPSATGPAPQSPTAVDRRDARLPQPPEYRSMTRPPHPPIAAAAARKVRLAEAVWNSRKPDTVVQRYSTDSHWRNRTEVFAGRAAVHAFPTRKWQHELDYRPITEAWAACGARLAVRFAYEWNDGFGNWFRSFGTETWEFDAEGLIRQRIVGINDLGIAEQDRPFRWPSGRRPDDHPGLSDLRL